MVKDITDYETAEIIIDVFVDINVIEKQRFDEASGALAEAITRRHEEDGVETIPKTISDEEVAHFLVDILLKAGFIKQRNYDKAVRVIYKGGEVAVRRFMDDL
jgi:hypothetical protein